MTNVLVETASVEKSVHPLRALIDGESVPFPNVEAKFSKLAAIWNAYNMGRSVIDYTHASHLQIIGMGVAVVPCLLRELQRGDGNWLTALKYITGAKVTTPAMRGNLTAIQDAWLKWGRQNGIG